MADNIQTLSDVDSPGPERAIPSRSPADPNSASQVKSRKSPLRLIIILLVLAAVVTGAVLWWMHAGTYESTDDAQVNAHLSAISSRVAGTVTAVYVEENQFVQVGQPIADLDPRDYQNALDQAQSQMLQNEAQVRAINPMCPITETSNRATVSGTEADLASAEAAVSAAERDSEAAEADLRQAEANSAKAQADVARYRPLVAKDEVPREQYDQVVATAKAQAALVDSRRASAAAARKTRRSAKCQPHSDKGAPRRGQGKRTSATRHSQGRHRDVAKPASRRPKRKSNEPSWIFLTPKLPLR